LYNLKYVILRIGNPFGPRMWDGLVVKDFLLKIKDKKPIHILGDGSQFRYFFYVGDIYNACFSIVNNNEKIGNELINITGDKKITITRLIRILETELGTEARVVKKPVRNCDLKLKYCPNHKAKRILDWRPSDFNSGIEKTVRWYSE